MCQKENFKGKGTEISKMQSLPRAEETESNSQLERLCKVQRDPLTGKATLEWDNP